MSDRYRIDPEELTWRCDEGQFAFETTEELPGLEGTIGQDRALTAIDFGLGIDDSGFNIFILGEPGTGRSSTIKKILDKRAKDEEVPDDWCYVADFDDDTQSTQLRLPAGKGKELHRDMEGLVDRLAEEIPKVFESKEYELQKSRIAEEYQEKNKRLYQELERRANAQNFLLQRTANGLALVPTKDDHPLSQEEYEALEQEERAALDARGAELQEGLNEVLQRSQELEKEAREAVQGKERQMLSAAIGSLFGEVVQKYGEFSEVVSHFDNCQKDILERIDEFRPSEGPKLALPGFRMGNQQPSFDRYRVNLLVDNSELEGAPVVYEANPTYFNLFGRIEHVIQMGNALTNFTMIKSGALHRANGGYLILDCRELFSTPFSYEAIKRCIRNREIKIEDMTEQFRLIATVTLKPQPIPLKCKIVIIGTPMMYYLLYRLDADFRKLFKVKADFDRMMKNTRKNVQQYALFVATQCRKENLLPFDPSGVARLVEYAARLIEDKNRISSRFLDISDVVREASYLAGREKTGKVGRPHVDRALEARIYRSNKLEERIQELIEDGTILVDVEGAVVGQVNGLSAYQMGDYSFGKPSRVTVRTYVGRGGVINIEREAKLSGPIHDKGIMILAGFFGERYARDKPLALAASICFEQSYSGIEGDSASSTELYGLLSSLSGLPVKQGIAVTGSVNQHGRVQPIGAANEKIEGFFEVCKARGLTGEQGVLIPAANVKNLMLKEEVIEAVSDGRFHIWAVETVDEGIEILTGAPAGEREEGELWPEGTVNFLVDRRLHELAEAQRKYAHRKGRDETS